MPPGGERVPGKRSSKNDSNMRPDKKEDRRRRRREGLKNGTWRHATEEEKRTFAWLKPTQFKPGHKFGHKIAGRKITKPITDRYREALEVKLPEDQRKLLGMPAGASMADVIAWRMVTLAAGENKRSIDAAKELREAIEGKATQPMDLNVLGGLPEKLRQMREAREAKAAARRVEKEKEDAENAAS